ncbi:hypothetical protein ACFSKL_10955 [Belliella marina]|uniref:Uncharacterized protein n=1 Tax=Belliella marina TaxID=1644146 RepID=A0ABW4VKZ4_9BACT
MKKKSIVWLSDRQGVVKSLSLPDSIFETLGVYRFEEESIQEIWRNLMLRPDVVFFDEHKNRDKFAKKVNEMDGDTSLFFLYQKEINLSVYFKNTYHPTFVKISGLI